MERKATYRLGWISITVLLLTAIIADAFTLIPFLGDMIAPIYWVLVGAFLYTRGFGILNPRRFITSITSMVGEMIPGIQALPLIITGVIVVIVFSRMEDKANSHQPEEAPVRKEPMNMDGVRRPSV